MSEPFIGEIRMVGFNFAPKHWALCNGQLLAISANTALFSLLGTTYGGDGRVTFALPDLRGRVPIHAAAGPGLTPRILGEESGLESVTLLQPEMPSHNHSLVANSQAGGAVSPTNGFIAVSVDSTGTENGAFAGNPNTALNPQSIGVAGSTQPHPNMQPYLCVNFIIALYGIFPSRN